MGVFSFFGVEEKGFVSFFYFVLLGRSSPRHTQVFIDFIEAEQYMECLWLLKVGISELCRKETEVLFWGL